VPPSQGNDALAGKVKLKFVVNKLKDDMKDAKHLVENFIKVTPDVIKSYKAVLTLCFRRLYI
jgi:hypothetical protein